jgi:hypothetical protein
MRDHPLEDDKDKFPEIESVILRLSCQDRVATGKMLKAFRENSSLLILHINVTLGIGV